MFDSEVLLAPLPDPATAADVLRAVELDEACTMVTPPDPERVRDLMWTGTWATRVTIVRSTDSPELLDEIVERSDPDPERAALLHQHVVDNPHTRPTTTLRLLAQFTGGDETLLDTHLDGVDRSSYTTDTWLSLLTTHNDAMADNPTRYDYRLYQRLVAGLFTAWCPHDQPGLVAALLEMTRDQRRTYTVQIYLGLLETRRDVYGTAHRPGFDVAAVERQLTDQEAEHFHAVTMGTAGKVTVELLEGAHRRGTATMYRLLVAARTFNDEALAWLDTHPDVVDTHVDRFPELFVRSIERRVQRDGAAAIGVCALPNTNGLAANTTIARALLTALHATGLPAERALAAHRVSKHRLDTALTAVWYDNVIGDDVLAWCLRSLPRLRVHRLLTSSPQRLGPAAYDAYVDGAGYTCTELQQQEVFGVRYLAGRFARAFQGDGESWRTAMHLAERSPATPADIISAVHKLCVAT